MEDKKVFKPTIWEKKLSLGGTLLFIAAGCLLIFSDELFPGPAFSFIGVASVLFGGLCFLVFLLSYLKGEPLLVVSENGVNISPDHFIPWRDVREVRVLQGDIEQIGIFTFEDFEETPSQDFLGRMAQRSWGTKILPTGVTSSTYRSITHVDIIEAFQKYHDQFLATLSEDEREKYVDVIPQIVDGKLQVRELKNTDEFGSGNEESTADFIDWEALMKREK